MLSTAYPPILLLLLTGLALLAAVGAIGIALYTKRLFREEFPGKTVIDGLRAEVSEFSGSIADLTERFARFQKREGMRAARDEKEKARTLKDQAIEIMAQNGSQEAAPGKAALYRKARGLNS